MYYISFSIPFLIRENGCTEDDICGKEKRNVHTRISPMNSLISENTLGYVSHYDSPKDGNSQSMMLIIKVRAEVVF